MNEKSSGLFAYSCTLAFLFASLANLQDTKEMFFWALGFSVIAFMDEYRTKSIGFGVGWACTIFGTYAAFALLGPLWSPAGFAVGYLLPGWFLVDRLQKRFEPKDAPAA